MPRVGFVIAVLFLLGGYEVAVGQGTPSGAPPAGAVRLGADYAQIAVDGAQWTVYYGVGASWLSISGTGRTVLPCEPATFGRDPAPNFYKACFSTGTSNVVTACAADYGSCTYSGPGIIEYGVYGSQRSLTVTAPGTLSCVPASFGGVDPAANVVKHCYFFPTTTTITPFNTDSNVEPDRGLSVAGGRVVWVAGGQLVSCPTTGCPTSGPTTGPTTLTADLHGPYAVVAGGRASSALVSTAYYANPDDQRLNALRRCGFPCTPPTDVQSFSGEAYALWGGLDNATRYIVWSSATSSSKSQISVCQLPGSATQCSSYTAELVTTRGQPADFLTVGGGTLVWTTGSAVYACPLAGPCGGRTIIGAYDGRIPGNGPVTTDGTTVFGFLTDRDHARTMVFSCPIGGCPNGVPTSIATIVGHPAGIAYDASRRTLYFATQTVQGPQGASSGVFSCELNTSNTCGTWGGPTKISPDAIRPSMSSSLGFDSGALYSMGLRGVYVIR